MTHAVARAVVLAGLLVAYGCATQHFAPEDVRSSAFIGRGVTQEQDSVVVTAAVPTAQELDDLVGLDLYGMGVQPIWLHVDNRREKHVRVALVSIDKEYYSPLEVAWLFRKQVSGRSRDELDRWFFENALPRHVPPGQSRSGFVFTRRSEGTKGFNIDIYSDRASVNFSFFVDMPGFTPDYKAVDFHGLYEEGEIAHVQTGQFLDILKEIACCTVNATDTALGDPLNVVIVGTPEAVRSALLRGGWQQTELNSPLTELARTHHYRGRRPDGTFHKSRPDGSERKELRLWLAPILVDGETVWLGHISYDMSGTLFMRDLSNYKIDPDVDDARMFLVQNFWYSQSLRKYALANGIPPSTINAPQENFHNSEYFTDGLRAVLFVSEAPVGMDETQLVQWEKPSAE